MSRRKLDDLRSEIRDVDDTILRLARKRIDLAKKIGLWKLRHGIPVRDFETEREVLALTAERCRKHGLDETLGREITRALIGGAVKIQEELRERRYEGSRRRISIVGGAGKMGRWLAGYLYSRGHRVTTYDTAGAVKGFHHTRSLEGAVKRADIIVLSVPLHAAAKTYRRVVSLEPAGTIVDLFSLKTPVLGEIARALGRGIRVTSIHPLFGPDVYLLSDRILLLCSCGDTEADGKVADLFSGTSLETVAVPVEEHDRAMGIVLGLSHAVNIILTEALTRSGLNSGELRKVATTTYLKQSRTASQVAGENPRLYYDIQHLNRYSPEVFELFRESFEAFRAAATASHPGAFVAMMKRGLSFFEDEEE